MSPISITHILECIGPSPDLIQKLIDHMLVTIPSHISAIEKAISQNDAPALQRTSHTLKGSLSYLKTEKALFLVRSLEKAGKDNQLENTPQLLEAFRSEAETILDYLRSGEWRKEIGETPN